MYNWVIFVDQKNNKTIGKSISIILHEEFKCFKILTIYLNGFT
jgi:hypothetical protein